MITEIAWRLVDPDSQLPANLQSLVSSYITERESAIIAEWASELAAEGPPEPLFGPAVHATLERVKRYGLAVRRIPMYARLAHMAKPPGEHVMAQFAPFYTARVDMGWLPPDPYHAPASLLPPDPDDDGAEERNAAARKAYMTSLFGATASAASLRCHVCHSSDYIEREMQQRRASDEMSQAIVRCRNPACIDFQARVAWGPGERHKALQSLRTPSRTATKIK
jgi:hypothetical protein